MECNVSDCRSPDGIVARLVASGVDGDVAAGLCDTYYRLCETTGGGSWPAGGCDVGRVPALEDSQRDAAGRQDPSGCESAGVVGECDDADAEPAVVSCVDDVGSVGGDVSVPEGLSGSTGAERSVSGGGRVAGHAGGVVDESAGVCQGGVRGRHWAANRRKRQLKKERKKRSVVDGTRAERGPSSVAGGVESAGGFAPGWRGRGTTFFGLQQSLRSSGKVRSSACGDKPSGAKVAQECNVPVWRRFAEPLSGSGFREPSGSGSDTSSCPSYGQALSDAEREAKESLARRRAAENAVAQRLAELKLESLNDEKRCEQINDLKRQRLVEWTQVSAAKTQESLERLKAAGGIVVTDEQHAKVLRKVKDLEYEYDVLKERVKMAGHYDLLADLKAPGTATEAYEQAQAEMWAYGSVHSEPTGSDAEKIKERLEEFDRVYLETGQPPPFRPLDEDDDRPRDPVADIMRYRNRDNYGGPEVKW